MGEEKRLIEKVFSIVDKDMSGYIDVQEMKDMFKFFGVDSHFLESAIQRIMANTDRNHDNNISADEFQALLSQKFSKDDSVEEMRTVFNQMNKAHDSKLKVEELHDVAKSLGDNMSKDEIKEMIKYFSRDFQKDLVAHNSKPKSQRPKNPPAEPNFLTLDDFVACMKSEIE